jgi:hypothetical protein
LEDELKGINEKLAEHSKRKSSAVATDEGKELCENALHLIHSYPWAVKTTNSWTLREAEQFHSKFQSLLIEANDTMNLVDGYESPPSDPLISLVASKAGMALSSIKNATKGAVASVPLLGKSMESHLAGLQKEVDEIKINGVSPSTKADWHLVLAALQRDKDIHSFHSETLEPLYTREGWPIDTFYSAEHMPRRRLLAETADIFAKVARVKSLSRTLRLKEEMEIAVECQRLDNQRTSVAAKLQILAQELVNATVVLQLSKSFSSDAQSALIRFSQIAGKYKFATSSQASKMTQRQRRRRQEYLDAFEKCVRYIPCWILTSPQISDYLPPQCLFDLVIIDEASQSDVTVLPGMMRGKQWLIVGDTKQVSPTDGFVAEEHIETLKAALPKSPLEDSLLPGHSFFDLCAQAYPNGRVILREHFRCAPEIISFSNSEFYDGSLTPLRLPRNTERMEPSLIDVRVPNGIKEGKINRAECDEIVERIQAYVSSCSTSNQRSIGVISLVGDEQSRLIRGRLLDAIGPKAMKDHDILVGDPPTFQGAERDMIFLSMVCSPGAVPTQSQLMHAQRVNVALSRARDRMVLVRSIDANHIPNEQDIKYTVLDFFQRAAAKTSDEDDSDSAADSENIVKSALSPFRVDAERLLNLQLQEKGYAISSMGVVWFDGICVEGPETGDRAALCVECSGESLDDWKRVVQQQKSIERVGWRCLRVDALSLIYDFHASMEKVIEFLTLAGVHPVIPREADSVVEVPDDEGEEQEEDAGERDEEGVPNNAANEAAPAVPAQGEEDEVVIISTDEENEEDNKKPAAMKAEDEPNETLGSGERDSDYGQAVDLGFLGMPQSSRPRYAPAKRRPRADSDASSSDSEDDQPKQRPFASRRGLAKRRKRAESDDQEPKRAYARGVARARNDNVGYGSDGSDSDTSLSSDQEDRYLGKNRSRTTKNSRKRQNPDQRESGDGSWSPPPDGGDDDEDSMDKKPRARASTSRNRTQKKKSSLSENSADSESEGESPMKKTDRASLETQSRSSKNSKRRRLDKYSRDGRWYPSSKKADEDVDVDYDQYMGEHAPEKLSNENKDFGETKDMQADEEQYQEKDVKPPVDAIIEIDQDADVKEEKDDE